MIAHACRMQTFTSAESIAPAGDKFFQDRTGPTLSVLLSAEIGMNVYVDFGPFFSALLHSFVVFMSFLDVGLFVTVFRLTLVMQMCSLRHVPSASDLVAVGRSHCM